MRIITQPKVTLVGQSTFIPHPDYDIPDETNQALAMTAFSAKACYDSFGKDGRSCEDNQRAILEHAHGSVLEHYHISLFIEGITRGLSLELNRHRTFNISQRSTRYTAEEDASFVLDPYYATLYDKYDITFDDSNNIFHSGEDVAGFDWRELTLIRDHLESLKMSQQEYEAQVTTLMELNPQGLEGFALRKWARGKARNLLPHALETRGTWTNNIRGFRWFLESRSSRHAEPEIRVLADNVLSTLRTVSPVHFEDFTSAGVFDGIHEWVPTYSKV